MVGVVLCGINGNSRSAGRVVSFRSKSAPNKSMSALACQRKPMPERKPIDGAFPTSRYRSLQEYRQSELLLK